MARVARIDKEDGGGTRTLLIAFSVRRFDPKTVWAKGAAAGLSTKFMLEVVKGTWTKAPRRPVKGRVEK